MSARITIFPSYEVKTMITGMGLLETNISTTVTIEEWFDKPFLLGATTG